MTSGGMRAILWLGLLLLAGCFQQAGETLQETGSTAEAIQQANPGVTVIAPTEEPTESQADVSTSPTIRPLSSGPVTATLPPITIIVQPTNAPRSTEPSETETGPSGSGETGEPTATTIQFITPGIPLGPALESTTASTDGSGAAATPSGLITPTALGSSADITINTSDVDSACIYVVESGDTVYSIALANDTTVDAIREVNPELEGENPIIQPGQELILPDCDGTSTDDEEATVEVEDELEDEPTSTSVPPVVAPSGSLTITATPGSTERYIVQRGDTLFIIAQRYGTTVAALVQANNLSNPDRLSIGQELIIPNQP